MTYPNTPIALNKNNAPYTTAFLKKIRTNVATIGDKSNGPNGGINFLNKSKYKSTDELNAFRSGLFQFNPGNQVKKHLMNIIIKYI